ncbi:MAG: HNH endonuclease [Candidatus Latescibacteria bacterium]|nr:HNH endonuclease [Candidatus Latescibacterota bacterium]
MTDDDLRDAPVLHHMVAITHLLKAVPAELRAIVRDQPPFEAAEFPLDSGSAGIKARRLAHRSFIDAAEAARQLGCPLAERIDDEYTLWLELTDPDPNKCAEGRMRLESKLRYPKIDLCLVRFGLQFGIELDNKLVEQEIERQVALNGEITFDSALARFALAFKQKTPEDAVNYIIRYHNELVGHIDKKMILSLQIELFSQIGQLDKANKHLDILLEEGLSEVEESRLRRRIAETEGIDPVESLKEQFKKTDSLIDLGNLVNELETRDDWESLCEYSEILFGRARTKPNAEKFASALHKAQKNKRLIEFLDSNKMIVGQSDELKMIYCWTLYLEGELLKTRSELAKLSNDWDDETYRTLQVNLAVSLGAWNSLSEFVARECNEKNKRSTKELIRAAQLALHLDSIPYAKELIFAAAEKGKDDANVLGIAYFLATKAGCEDQETIQWMYKAVALSGDDGPIWQMPLKEIWGQKQEWERRESEIWDKLSRSELPMFLAAHSLNKSLSDLMLFPTLANPRERDPRRRGNISAYSGQRQPLSPDTSRQIGMDATALLTLSFLGLLDEVLDAFDTVHIPHSTLGWLFDEKQRIAFHQPSRIKDAHKIRDLLATGALEKLSPSTVSDSDLSEQVGEELALFIAEAEKERTEDKSQQIVVQPSPVHRIGSLMEEEADLTAHATVLSSCQSVVDKLQQKGRITVNEAQKARAYLKLHEKPWPYQPEIADRAILYLDDLAVNYFLHLGMLEKLQAAGFKAIISPTKQSETNQLISYESISGEAKDAIERIRSVVSSGIESKKIKIGRLTNANPSVDRSISEHPTATLFHLLKYCDAIIIDDRFFNQHNNFNDGDASKPIFSTLDIIDWLVSIDTKKIGERREYRTRLRQAGYIFVPVSEDELVHYLEAS